jgi:signal transduction histidine kinase
MSAIVRRWPGRSVISMRRAFLGPGMLATILQLVLATAPSVAAGRETPTPNGVDRNSPVDLGFSGIDSHERRVTARVGTTLAVEPTGLSRDLPPTPSITDASQLSAVSEMQFAYRLGWRRRYTWRLVVTVLIILAQGMLITKLLTQLRQRRLAERALQGHLIDATHASRLAIAGELTASIAHEIKQPLAAILSNTEAAEMVLQFDRDPRESLRPILADIRRDDLRASEVIRRLRALLARHEVEHSPTDLNAIVADACALLQGEAERRDVRIEKQQDSVAPIAGDRTQIQQVLINLIMNAMDAVAGVSGERRKIFVSVTSAEGYCTVRVRDLGEGIRTGELPKIFKSFYSSKRAGMGLGLSITRTIVESHGGFVKVTSRLGEGSEFLASFPSSHFTVQDLRTTGAT